MVNQTNIRSITTAATRIQISISFQIVEAYTKEPKHVSGPYYTEYNII